MGKENKPLKSLPVVNVVLGTAGHIDHGKTALIKRLTGIDADRFKEEQERGMTIDIGYAHMVVDRKLNLGIIDVPGHERFIKNMVAGATGVGVVILVVAADDGVMPQTREHLEILRILGVDLGVVALTKIDLVDPDLADLAEEDVRELVRSTFLEGAPLVRVSSASGEGFDELDRVLTAMVEKARGPSAGGPLYLPVQRAFAAEGYGTVITGVPTRGAVNLGDVLEIVPAGRTVRVRGIEAYGNRIEHARAGHRTALNLTEVGHRDVHRGDVVCTPGYFRAWPSVAARLKVLGLRRTPLKNQAAVRFHVGCAETTGRAFLMEGNALAPGEEGLVQFRFDAPIVAAPGDRFIIRSISPTVTLGGGMVLRGTERKLKRRPWVIEEALRWERAAGSGRDALVEALREAGAEPPTRKDLAQAAGLLVGETEALLATLIADGEVRAVGTGDRFLLGEVFASLEEKAAGELRAFHGREPMTEGMDRVELRRAMGVGKLVLESVLASLAERGKVDTEANRVRLREFAVTLSDEDRAGLERLEGVFREAGVMPPTPSEALAGFGEERGPALYRLLVQREVLVEIVPETMGFHREVLEDVRRRIVEEIQSKGALVASDFRDRLGTTRKYIIPLLEHFDKIGLTIRVDNQRFLRERGRTPPREEPA